MKVSDFALALVLPAPVAALTIGAALFPLISLFCVVGCFAISNSTLAIRAIPGMGIVAWKARSSAVVA